MKNPQNDRRDQDSSKSTQTPSAVTRRSFITKAALGAGAMALGQRLLPAAYGQVNIAQPAQSYTQPNILLILVDQWRYPVPVPPFASIDRYDAQVPNVAKLRRSDRWRSTGCYCSKPACRKESKAQSQRRWQQRPEYQNYFRSPENCERVKDWRKRNPGYSRKKKSATQGPLQEVFQTQPAQNEELIFKGFRMRYKISSRCNRLLRATFPRYERHVPITTCRSVFKAHLRRPCNGSLMPRGLSDAGMRSKQRR